MFGKVQLSVAVLLLIQKSEVQGLKLQKNIKWPQRIDNDVDPQEHPEFPTGKLNRFDPTERAERNHRYSNSFNAQIGSDKEWPQRIDSDVDPQEHPNFPTGKLNPFDPSERAERNHRYSNSFNAQIASEKEWPQRIDSDLDPQEHPNFPTGKLNPFDPTERAENNHRYSNSFNAQIESQKEWPQRIDSDVDPQEHPEFPTGKLNRFDPTERAERNHRYRNSFNAQVYSQPQPVNQQSDPIVGSAHEYNPKKSWELKYEKPLGYPINYPVPNLGIDKDIVDTEKSLKTAEKMTGKTWNLKSLSQTEENEQIQSDPICHSAGGCNNHRSADWRPLPYPHDYPVANFGVDGDVLKTQNSLKQAEQEHGKSWNLQRGADGKFILPHEDIEFKLAQVENDGNVDKKGHWTPFCDSRGWCGEPQPIGVSRFCSSAGYCGEKWPKGWRQSPPAPVVYPVGEEDSDIADTKRHIEQQEKIHGLWRGKLAQIEESD